MSLINHVIYAKEDMVLHHVTLILRCIKSIKRGSLLGDFFRHVEETSAVFVDEIGPRGVIYQKKVYPPGGYYPWKGRAYQGPKGPVKISIPFLFGPQKAWKSISDPKQIPIPKTA